MFLGTAWLLLMFIGIAPAVGSASVHMAEIATTLVSVSSHWRLGGVEQRQAQVPVRPGALGMFVGAALLVRVPGTAV